MIWAGIAPAWVGLYIPDVVLGKANAVKCGHAFVPTSFHAEPRLAGMEKSKEFRAGAKNWHEIGNIPVWCQKLARARKYSEIDAKASQCTQRPPHVSEVFW